MSDPAAPALTRRALFQRIGAGAGGAAMLEAMRSLGFAAESPYRGPIELEGDPKGASVVILGAGLAGMTAAYRTRPRRLQGSGPRIQQPSRRPELVDPRRRRLHRARRRDAALRLRRGPLLQSGTVANPLPPPRHPRLLPQVRRRARALHPAQSQRLSALGERVRRKAAAHPRGQGRFRRRRVRASRQGGQERRARRGGLEGRPGNPARGVAGSGRPRQGISLPGRRRIRPPIAATPKTRAGA